MPNNPYSNFVIENEIEDQFLSHLDLERFCEVDDTLTLNDGMKIKIHRYSATNGTEKLAQGVGNSQTITAGYVEVEYDIACAQNRFSYYDEELMKDPAMVLTGTKHMGTDMFNTTNGDVYAEFKKAVKVVPVASFNFNCFADAEAMLGLENLEDIEIFAFVSPDDVAGLRKALKDDLKYVEAFAKQGYIGTVGGCNVYTKADATSGLICLGVKGAVTKFIKNGISSEVERDANTRKNTEYFRKYYVCALTDEKLAVKIVIGTASLSVDTTVSSSKTYYEKVGLGYVVVVPAGTEDPSAKGWYEIA